MTILFFADKLDFVLDVEKPQKKTFHSAVFILCSKRMTENSSSATSLTCVNSLMSFQMWAFRVDFATACNEKTTANKKNMNIKIKSPVTVESMLFYIVPTNCLKKIIFTL